MLKTTVAGLTPPESSNHRLEFCFWFFILFLWELKQQPLPRWLHTHFVVQHTLEPTKRTHSLFVGITIAISSAIQVLNGLPHLTLETWIWLRLHFVHPPNILDQVHSRHMLVSIITFWIFLQFAAPLQRNATSCWTDNQPTAKLGTNAISLTSSPSTHPPLASAR